MSAARLWAKVAVQTVFPAAKCPARCRSYQQAYRPVEAGAGQNQNISPKTGGQIQTRQREIQKAKTELRSRKTEARNLMGNEEWWGKRRTQEKGRRTVNASNHGREGDCSGEREERTRKQRSVQPLSGQFSIEKMKNRQLENLITFFFKLHYFMVT